MRTFGEADGFILLMALAAITRLLWPPMTEPEEDQ